MIWLTRSLFVLVVLGTFQAQANITPVEEPDVICRSIDTVILINKTKKRAWISGRPTSKSKKEDVVRSAFEFSKVEITPTFDGFNFSGVLVISNEGQKKVLREMRASLLTSTQSTKFQILDVDDVEPLDPPTVVKLICEGAI